MFAHIQNMNGNALSFVSAAFLGFFIVHPALHSAINERKKSTVSWLKNSKAVCSALKVSPFMYFLESFISSRSLGLPVGDSASDCFIVRRAIANGHGQLALRSRTIVKPFLVEWCGQRAGNSFIISEHCHGRPKNPQGLGFTFVLRSGLSALFHRSDAPPHASSRSVARMA